MGAAEKPGAALMQIDVSWNGRSFIAIVPGLQQPVIALSLGMLRQRIAAVMPDATLRLGAGATREQRARAMPSDVKRSAKHKAMWAK